jgi:hypothetical protein
MDNNLPDHKLVELGNKGIEEAMNILYYRYRDWVYGLAFRLCGNREDAQEKQSKNLPLSRCQKYHYQQYP